jgi:hypothetical protein
MNKKEKILQLHKLGYTNKEIENETKFKISSIRWAINSEKLKANKYSQINFDSKFFEFMLGGLLGDSSITNKRLNISHSINQEKYCIYKYNILKNYKLAGKLSYNKIISDRYKNGFIEEIRFKSLTHSIFENLKELYYFNNIKRIPNEDYLKNYLTPFALSIWFQDDGNKCLSNLQFNTQGFLLEDINKIRYILLEKYLIKTSVNKHNVITILGDSNIKFYNLISPYVIESMKYKILPTRVLNKQGELLEHPTSLEDNQQPSLTSNSFEGSTTNSRIQTDNAEDSNGNTSTLPFKTDADGFVTTYYNDTVVKWKPISGIDY